MDEDWQVFQAGEKIRCPGCHKILGLVGAGFLVRVRPNPRGQDQPPTDGVGQAQHCKGCGTNLEYEHVRAA